MKNIAESYLKKLRAYSKRKFFCLATTANKNNPDYYLASFRETNTTISGSALFRSTENLPYIINLFDGHIEKFFIDIEIKNDLVNLPLLASQLIKKSKIAFFKPNDFTIQALSSFLNHISPTPIYESTVCIIGCGNIGSKIGLTCLESGAEVVFIDPNMDKVFKIIDGFQQFNKRKLKFKIARDLSEYSQKIDILMGCTAGTPAISRAHLNHTHSNSVFIDVGNGTFSDEAISEISSNNKYVYCLNSLPGYCGFIESNETTQTIVDSIGSKKLSEGVVIITPGIIGNKGDILVNQLVTPRTIIGVCNGKGDILENKDAEPFIKRYENYVEK